MTYYTVYACPDTKVFWLWRGKVWHGNCMSCDKKHVDHVEKHLRIQPDKVYSIIPWMRDRGYFPYITAQIIEAMLMPYSGGSE